MTMNTLRSPVRRRWSPRSRCRRSRRIRTRAAPKKAPARGRGRAATPAKKTPAAATATPTPSDPYATGTGRARADGDARDGSNAGRSRRASASPIVTAVQGLLAVQHLDGWLLFDRDGENPIAVRLVAPDGHPQRPWFYMIPAQGEPIALVHTVRAAQLRSPARQEAHVPGLSRSRQAAARDAQGREVDRGRVLAEGGGAERVARRRRHARADPRDRRRTCGRRDTLVQYTKAIWGDAGRTAHYVAVHHLVELRKEALAFVTKRLRPRTSRSPSTTSSSGSCTA